jgi:hypothetical protein
MRFAQGCKSKANRGRNPPSSILKRRHEHIDVQPFPDVRPLSFSFQCGGSQYRINFRTEGDHSKTEITRDSRPYMHIDAVVKRKKCVRFQDPPSTQERQSRPSILKAHVKGRPQRPVEDVVIQVARANQRKTNEQALTHEGGYHDWFRLQDNQAAQHEQDQQCNCCSPDNGINKLKPGTIQPSVERNRRTKSRMSSGNHGCLLSPRPIPVRYYPNDNSSEAARGAGPFHPLLEPVTSNPQPQASITSNYVANIRANFKQPMNVTELTSINLGAPVSRRKSRKRLTKLRML